MDQWCNKKYMLKLWNTFPHRFFQITERVATSCVTFLSREVIPKTAIMVLLLVIFLIMVTYHARLVEVTSRLDFLWKQQAERELADMMETRANNTQLLKNILPDHVAQHFLGEDRPTEVGGRRIHVRTFRNFGDQVIRAHLQWFHPVLERKYPAQGPSNLTFIRNAPLCYM
jgi:hypothetical protein